MNSWVDEIVFIEDWHVKRGEAVFHVDDAGRNACILHPSDMLLQLGKGRFPFESRYNLGIREMERDRRRYPR